MSVDVVASGLADGVLLFLIASGLTLTFGVMRVINFAHGGFFMLGAFGVFQLVGGRPQTGLVFLGAAVLAGTVVGVLGAISEKAVYRRLYAMDPESSLLATFALLLILQGAGQAIWGLDPRSVAVPTNFGALLHVAGGDIPLYNLVLLAIGVVVAAGLQYLLRYTELGRTVRAVAEDRFAASILGVNVNAVFVSMFALGVFLAGLGGALAAPTLGLTPDLGSLFILQAFAVIVIGGPGSVPGALIAALLLGLLNSLLVRYAPSLAEFSVYIALIVVLLARPRASSASYPQNPAEAGAEATCLGGRAVLSGPGHRDPIHRQWVGAAVLGNGGGPDALRDQRQLAPRLRQHPLVWPGRVLRVGCPIRRRCCPRMGGPHRLSSSPRWWWRGSWRLARGS